MSNWQKPICFNCRHFNEEESACLAYPLDKGKDIPDEILNGTDDHSEVREDQTGDFVFERLL